PRWHAVYFKHRQPAILIADHVDAGKVGSNHAGGGDGKISHHGVGNCGNGFATAFDVCHPMRGVAHHGWDYTATRDEYAKVAETVAFDTDKSLKIVDASYLGRRREVLFTVYQPQAAALRTE